MSQCLTKQLKLIKEMEEVEKGIIALNIEVERLKSWRHELLAEKEDLEMREVVEYAVETGVSTSEMMRFVSYASRVRATVAGNAIGNT